MLSCLSIKFFAIILLIIKCLVLIDAQSATNSAPQFRIGDTEFLVWNQTKFPWKEALKFCANNDMQLLTIESEEKQMKLNEQLEKLGFIDRPEIDNRFIYWTSGNDNDSRGNFVWASTGEAFKYTNWLPGMPDNWQKNEHCVEMGFRELGKWNDTQCKYRRHFICERFTGDSDKNIV
ncbi:lectin subunit alpha-like [Teleopsis dalmanni]|uniref:lectin subunit alpha-like n=1 Tax=Teleopsis dalmanni TaxID=139649 RepID=UPI0018CEF5F7|nr:lectin subunit alpha-like [Teleopsis dalmanni]